MFWQQTSKECTGKPGRMKQIVPTKEYFGASEPIQHCQFNTITYDTAIGSR